MTSMQYDALKRYGEINGQKTMAKSLLCAALLGIEMVKIFELPHPKRLVALKEAFSGCKSGAKTGRKSAVAIFEKQLKTHSVDIIIKDTLVIEAITTAPDKLSPSLLKLAMLGIHGIYAFHNHRKSKKDLLDPRNIDANGEFV